MRCTKERRLPAQRILGRLSVLAVLLALPVAGATAGDSSLRSVVFSELTIDAPPGTDGSWVELYNRGSTPVDLEGVQVIANGTSVVTFPAATVLESDVLLLVSFSGDCAAPQRAEEPNWRPVTCVTFRAPVRLHSPPARAMGFCALVKPGKGDEAQLRDYVRWGKGYLPEDDIWVPKARELGIASRGGGYPEDKPGLSPESRDFYHQANLHIDSVFIGLGFWEPGIARSPPLGQAVIVRWVFGERSNRLGMYFPWGIIQPQDATPGKGNTRLPVPVCVILGQEMPTEQRVGIYLHEIASYLRKMSAQDSTDLVRFQVAGDQHFMSVVADRWFERPQDVAIPDLQPGRYYGRIMWQVGARQSRWTDAMSFTIEEPKSTAPEEAQGRLKDDPALPPTAVRELDAIFGKDRLEKGQAGEKKEK